VEVVEPPVARLSRQALQDQPTTESSAGPLLRATPPLRSAPPAGRSDLGNLQQRRSRGSVGSAEGAERVTRKGGTRWLLSSAGPGELAEEGEPQEALQLHRGQESWGGVLQRQDPFRDRSAASLRNMRTLFGFEGFADRLADHAGGGGVAEHPERGRGGVGGADVGFDLVAWADARAPGDPRDQPVLLILPS